MAENEEESEMAAQFGNLLRVALGSGMQIREAQARRAQMRTAERSAEADRVTRAEATVAGLVNREVYTAEFWRTAGSESIADRVTVAAHLAGTHAEARGAWMHAADVLRNDYGINLEAMNKEHPASLVDRHAALRDALDDYFARQRLDAEHDKQLTPPVGRDSDVTFQAVAYRQNGAMNVSLSKEEALNYLDGVGNPFAIDDVDLGRWTGLDGDVDAALAYRRPDLFTEEQRQALPDVGPELEARYQQRHRNAAQSAIDFLGEEEARRQGALDPLPPLVSQPSKNVGDQRLAENTEPSSGGASLSNPASPADKKDADAAAVDENAHQDLADRYGAEAQQDQANAQAKEQTGGRSPHQYQRVTDAQLAQIERHANAPQLALVRARQAAGFPQPTAERITPSAQATKAKKPAATGRGLGQGQEAGLSR